MKNLIYILLAAFLFTACNNAEKKEAEVENDLAETKVSAENKELPELSIYNLPSTWTTQNGENIQLEDLRGNVLVMVMIYTSCKAACPRLVADMRNIEKQVPEEALENVKFIM
ncbi:MAG: SCO family protein, partial [Salinimicrobium sediminis]|nr:SCO family protein [Salinimicrobium sediminis]